MAKGRSPMAQKKPAAIAFNKAAAQYRSLRNIGDDRVFADLFVKDEHGDADYGTTDLWLTRKERTYTDPDSGKVKVAEQLPTTAGGHTVFSAARDKDERLSAAIAEMGQFVNGAYMLAYTELQKETVDVDVHDFIFAFTGQVARMAGMGRRGAFIVGESGSEIVWDYEGPAADGVEVLYSALVNMGAKYFPSTKTPHPVVAQQTAVLAIAMRTWKSAVLDAKRLQGNQMFSLDAMLGEGGSVRHTPHEMTMTAASDCVVTDKEGNVLRTEKAHEAVLPGQERLRPHNPEMSQLHYKRDTRAAEDLALAYLSRQELAWLVYDMHQVEIAGKVLHKDPQVQAVAQAILFLRSQDSLSKAVSPAGWGKGNKEYRKIGPGEIGADLFEATQINDETILPPILGFTLPGDPRQQYDRAKYIVRKALEALQKAEDVYMEALVAADEYDERQPYAHALRTVAEPIAYHGVGEYVSAPASREYKIEKPAYTYGNAGVHVVRYDCPHCERMAYKHYGEFNAAFHGPWAR